MAEELVKAALDGNLAKVVSLINDGADVNAKNHVN